MFYRYRGINFGRSASLVNNARTMRTAVVMGASLAAFLQEPEVEPICDRNVRGSFQPCFTSAFQRPSMCGKLVSPSQNGAGRTMHDIVIRGGSIVDGTGAPAPWGRRHRWRPHRPGRRQGRSGPARGEGRRADRHAGLGRRAHTMTVRPPGIPSSRRPPGTARPSCSAIAAWASPRPPTTPPGA